MLSVFTVQARSCKEAQPVMAVSDGLQPDASGGVLDAKPSAPPDMNQMSYAEQYDYLVSQPKGSVNFKKPCKKPSLEAQVRLEHQCLPGHLLSSTTWASCQSLCGSIVAVLLVFDLYSHLTLSPVPQPSARSFSQ